MFRNQAKREFWFAMTQAARPPELLSCALGDPDRENLASLLAPVEDRGRYAALSVRTVAMRAPI